jgi:hypothetical protein
VQLAATHHQPWVDRLAGGIHRPILIKVIEHNLHRTLTLLGFAGERHW